MSDNQTILLDRVKLLATLSATLAASCAGSRRGATLIGMKARDIAIAQVMAKQQRRQELLLAKQAGVKPRKPGFIERWVLGIRK